MPPASIESLKSDYSKEGSKFKINLGRLKTVDNASE